MWDDPRRQSILVWSPSYRYAAVQRINAAAHGPSRCISVRAILLSPMTTL
jgi:hypothetical protein